MNIYRDRGFKSRSEYMESLADEFDMDIETVWIMADMLGPNEDFDGLVTTLEDMCMEL